MKGLGLAGAKGQILQPDLKILSIYFTEQAMTVATIIIQQRIG
jgi:hypothetical protein